jgi:hypothetical protein
VADFNAARYANETRGFPTQREIWESVVAMPRWQGKELVAVELHPITLGFGLPASERGRKGGRVRYAAEAPERAGGTGRYG